MTVQRIKGRISLLSVFVLLLLVCAAAALALLRPKGDPAQALQARLDMLSAPVDPSLTGRGTEPTALAGIDAEIAEAYDRCLRFEARGPFAQKLRSASGTVVRTRLDTELLNRGLSDEMQAMLAERAAIAKRSAELYTPDGAVLPELCGTLYADAMRARLAHAEDYCRTDEYPVTMTFEDGEWQTDLTSLLPDRVPSKPGYEVACTALTPVYLHYTLPPTGPGPVPNPACYGETSDPQDIARLLESPTAQRLIGGQKLDFDPKRDMLGRPFYYYLDETILALVWQQDEHGAVGTFAEVLISDPSQLRRKLADDTFGTLQYYTPSEFAAQTNAVLACSGDFYNSGRADYGLYVYNGELMRSNLSYGQSCLFNNEGDMLFTYENQFGSVEEAERFIRDNHVPFSLSFGPVLIDQGQDVTPYDYLFGEVREGYARCCVGQLGKLHYLMMTINCEYPDHDVYVTLRQAADSMIAHGCVNAYTLDGGQTGSILIGGKLINPVQFGAEREMSDIFYFATALPND